MEDTNIITTNADVVTEIAAPEMVLIEGRKGSFWARLDETVVINCVDCNAERRIKVQDKFHTDRCVSCKKKTDSAKRSAKGKAKRAEEAQAKAVEEARKMVLAMSEEDIKAIREGAK